MLLPPLLLSAASVTFGEDAHRCSLYLFRSPPRKLYKFLKFQLPGQAVHILPTLLLSGRRPLGITFIQIDVLSEKWKNAQNSSRRTSAVQILPPLLLTWKKPVEIEFEIISSRKSEDPTEVDPDQYLISEWLSVMATITA